MNSKFEIKGGYHIYEEITFLKGFSITTIVFMHLIQKYMTYFPEIFLKLSSFGGTGVHVFFFCSGFGLFLSYKKRESSFITFIKKRFGKIYFPYIFVVLITFGVPYITVDGDRFITLLSHIFLPPKI